MKLNYKQYFHNYLGIEYVDTQFIKIVYLLYLAQSLVQ